MSEFLFVYGTLRPGGRETFGVPGKLYDLGWFPGIKLGGEGTVVCERVPVTDWAPVDRYEGYNPDDLEGSLYIRRPYLLLTEVGNFEGFIYEFNRDITKGWRGGFTPKLIESGDWLQYRQEERGSHGRRFGSGT